MNTKPHSTNVWFEFYDRCWRRYGRSLAKSSVESWKDLIDKPCFRNDLLLQFFALARYEAEQGEPLVSCKDYPAGCVHCKDNSKACVKPVAENLGFKYSFTSHKEKLAEQLGKIGVKLLEAPKGEKKEKQYLRTIHRLSGAVYLKAAKKAAAISPDMWIVNEALSPVISEEVKKYIKGDEGDVDGEGLAEDVLGFFRALRKAYRRYNDMPTMASFRKEAPQELSDKMLKAILKALKPLQGANISDGANSALDDSRPIFRFDEQNRVVLGFRPQQNPIFHVDESVRTVRFVFKRRGGEDLSIRFHRSENGWRTNTDAEISRCVPIGDLESIRRTTTVFSQDGTRVEETVDVTPTALTDPETPFLLFRRNANGRSAHAIVPSEALPRGVPLFVVWLHGQSRMPVQWKAEDNADWTGIEVCGCGEFTVPNEAQSLRIGKDEYDVVTVVDEWLDRSAAFGTKPTGGHVLNPGGRLFFETGVFPYSDAFIENVPLRVRYQKANGTVCNFVDGHLREIPDDLLWDRGRVEFYDSQTNETMGTRVVTFLPEIDDSALSRVFDIDRDGTVAISAAGETFEATVPRADDGKVTDHVDFTLHGFSICYPVKRSGILVKVAGSGEESMPLRPGQWLELARDDFDAAVFSADLPDENNQLDVIFSIGTKPVHWIGNGKKHFRFTSHDLTEDNNDSSFASECVFSSGELNLGNIRLYRPDETPIDEVTGLATKTEREDDDLHVSFWIARRWRNKPLSLVYLPAHRQDEKPCSVRATDVSFSPANGRLRADLHIEGFYARKTDDDTTKGIDWGTGLLCFIAFPESDDGTWHPVSSGFFLPRPDDACDPWPLPEEEDPFGLRAAMAQCDLDAIDRIMMSKDKACRDEIKRFESQSCDNLHSLGRKNMRYFHAYYSRCRKVDGSFEPSGYFFMAGWLAQEKMVNKFPFIDPDETWPHLKMAEDYKSMWSPLMTPFTDEDTQYWKCVSQNMLAENGEHVWVTAQTIYGSSMEQEMSKIINDTKNEFAVFLKCHECPPFDPVSDDVSFVKPHKNAFWDEKETELDTCLSCLAKWVVEWRKHPACNTAQPLRDLLLRVEQIDTDIINMIENDNKDEKDNDTPVEWNYIRPQFTLTDRIAMKLWLLD